ncbi:MAG TPA: class E sortase [Candidatus Saccharimonadales bacterium]|nr:class E sortase [Candidatus Saccharimonadales bacterium]
MTDSISKSHLHRQINNVLSVMVVGLALYILVWPFLPAANLWWRSHTGAGNGYVYHSKLQKGQKPSARPIPADNRLVIPKMRLDEPINEGKTIAALHTGVWRRPATDTPDKGGNTVIVGHRFTYSGSSVFYSLNTLEAGDPVIVYWQGKEYDYEVMLSEVVPPNAVEIEQHTEKPILTLYTCTPLWTAHDRLVVIAEPL